MKKTTQKTKTIVPVINPTDPNVKYFNALKHRRELAIEVEDVRKEANDVTPQRLMDRPEYYQELSSSLLRAYQIKSMLNLIIEPYLN